MAETPARELQCSALGWVTKDAEPVGRRQEGYYASRNVQREMTRVSLIRETFSKCRVDEKQRGKARFFKDLRYIWYCMEMGKVRDFVRAVVVTDNHMKKRKLQNLEAIQDWLSVSDNISNRRIEIAEGKKETWCCEI